MSQSDTIVQLEAALQESKDVILKQRAALDKLTADPLAIGTVIDGEDKPIVSVNGAFFQVERPENLLKRVRGLSPGESVLLNPETQQIVSHLGCIPTGEIATVQTIGDKGKSCTVECHEGRLHVIIGNVKIEEGDEVILDPTRNVVIAKSAGHKDDYQFENVTGVTWKDIGGLEAAKQTMIEAIELPFQYAGLYNWYKKKPIKGVELYGPPGCGKTMLAKAVVSALQRIHGKKARGGFYYIKGPEILNPFVGNSEAGIRRLFARARKYFKETGIPAVIAIDEAESILSKRGSGISSDMEKTIVPMFLAEMDGLDESSAIVLLLTNRADRLDPAVIRPGRIDRRVKVDRPDEAAASRIFKIYLDNARLSQSAIAAGATKKWPKSCAARLFDDRYTLYQLHLATGVLNFKLGHVCSGAMIANIVDQATTSCLMADIQSGRTRVGKGLNRDALDLAINNAYAEAHADNQDDTLREFVVELPEDVKTITKFTQGSTS